MACSVRTVHLAEVDQGTSKRDLAAHQTFIG